MPKRLHPYAMFICKDCDSEFIIPRQVKRPFCPNCGDGYHVEKFKNLRLERPFNYKKTWTEEENAIVIEGKRRGLKSHQIAEQLDGRTWKAINRHYSELGKRGIFS